jgi:hypothetical protein
MYHGRRKKQSKAHVIYIEVLAEGFGGKLNYELLHR